jgi:hypothetical protein
MSYRLFYKEGAPTGDKDMRIQCISAIFGYQIQGATGAKVRFSATNRQNPDINNPAHWVKICEIEKLTADDQELGHTTGHSYDTIMYEVLQGPVDIMVSTGVAG